MGIAGVGISIAYIILSSIEHFYKAGFGLAVFGLIASSLYCFFSYRVLKLHQTIASGQENLDKLKQTQNKRTMSGRQLSKTTLILMQE